MQSSVIPTNSSEQAAEIAIVGGGPAALVLAIALARRGIRTTIFERDAHPEIALRFNPDRSYTIDISGHGLKALRHIDACSSFDGRMIQFKGLKTPDGQTEEWTLPGWTGSRGDILRSLMAVADEKHHDQIRMNFESRVNFVDVNSGTVTYSSKSENAATRQFDFIIGADGTGSIVRKAMVEQIPEFTVEKQSFPNYCTMIELDRVGDQLDKNYLHGLAVFPFCVAGAIKGDPGIETPRWFCAIGTKAKQEFSSFEEARSYLSKRIPRLLELTRDEKIAAFAQRTCYHIGQTLTCSQLAGGKAALLGDAAAAFPPIGQGVNAAMESAMVLDRCIGEVGNSETALVEAARLYSDKWKPEADAVSWMAVKSLFENRYHMFRANLTMKLGMCIFTQAKSAEIPYSEVRRKAKRLWPLWV
jgi:2-polyprenyl-6-methoxyphenol hydroxylase-like FAD-dependent oxidoreductase